MRAWVQPTFLAIPPNPHSHSAHSLPTGILTAPRYAAAESLLMLYPQDKFPAISGQNPSHSSRRLCTVPCQGDSPTIPHGLTTTDGGICGQYVTRRGLELPPPPSNPTPEGFLDRAHLPLPDDCAEGLVADLANCEPSAAAARVFFFSPRPNIGQIGAASFKICSVGEPECWRGRGGWLGGTMYIRISRRAAGLEKAPEVILIWHKEQDGAEEAGKGGAGVCHPVCFVETAPNPTNRPLEPSGQRAGGKVTRGARSGAHGLEGGGVPSIKEQERGSPLHATAPPHPALVLAFSRVLLSHALILFLSAPWPRLMASAL